MAHEQRGPAPGGRTSGIHPLILIIDLCPEDPCEGACMRHATRTNEAVPYVRLSVCLSISIASPNGKQIQSNVSGLFK